MTTRKFDTLTWSDPWFESLRPNEKLLFLYLWTNDVCNQAGLYHISRRRIEFETGIKIDGVIESLAPKVAWYPEIEVVWVKKFTERQAQNKNFFESALRCAEKFNGLKDDWIRFNQGTLNNYGIEYQPPLNTPSTVVEPPTINQDQFSSDQISCIVQPPTMEVEPTPPKQKWVYKKKVTIPKDFELTDELRAFAKEKGYQGNVERFTELFIQTCNAKGYQYQNWPATWRSWLLKDIHEKQPDKPQRYGERN